MVNVYGHAAKLEGCHLQLCTVNVLTAIELTAKRSFNRHHTGRRDKQSKKCNFCLSKREEPEIVTHHNLFDDNGLVSCPILQEYECELCLTVTSYY